MTATSARGPYRTGLIRRTQIIEAAWQIFARRGYATASLREIGDAVGVTPTTLLKHFGTKEGLLIAVLDHWAGDTDHLRSRSDAGEGLDHFLAYPALMRYHVAHPGPLELFLCLSAEATDPDHPARDWLTARYARMIREGVADLQLAATQGRVRAMTADEATLEVRGLYAAMDGLELQWITDPSIDLVAHFEHAFAATLRRWGVAESEWSPV